MKKIKFSSTPIYHELKFKLGFFDRVYWPCHSVLTNIEDTMVTILNNGCYITENGDKYLITSIKTNSKYPTLTYKKNGKGITDKRDSETSVSWFAYNIALKSKLV